MIDYTTLPGLSGVYLEDSYVLEIVEHTDHLVFRLDAVLTPEHAAYRQPRPGEHYCYEFADLVFRDVVRIEWINKSVRRFTDATGQTDLGNIDSLKFDGSMYVSQGDWGAVRIESAPPRFETRGFELAGLGMAGMNLNLNGRRVQSILIEYTVVFTLSGDHFIVIESPFRFERGSDAMTLSPEDDSDEALQPIRELKGLTVDEVTISDAGDLYVRFSDGTQLFVESDDAYEAWNVSGPNGFLIVCTPGGALACWSGNSD